MKHVMIYCVLLFVGLFVVGCTTGTQFMQDGLSDSVHRLDELQKAAIDYSLSSKAKAEQDQKRLDDALVLRMSQIAGQVANPTPEDVTKYDTNADGVLNLVEKQEMANTLILEAMGKYKASCDSIRADLAVLDDRDRQVGETINHTKETLSDMLTLEIRRSLNSEQRQTLIDKALTSDFLKTILPSGK
jgi:hypothetical protein